MLTLSYHSHDLHDASHDIISSHVMFSPFGVFQSVCLCACVCSWTCSCRVPSKESKLHWYNITVNRLWSALINPSRGYEAETLHKCSRSRLRITAERPISDYWPVALYIYINIYIYIYICVCVWSPSKACPMKPRLGPRSIPAIIFDIPWCITMFLLCDPVPVPLLDGAAVDNQTFW